MDRGFCRLPLAPDSPDDSTHSDCLGPCTDITLALQKRQLANHAKGSASGVVSGRVKVRKALRLARPNLKFVIVMHDQTETSTEANNMSAARKYLQSRSCRMMGSLALAVVPMR